MHAAVALVVLLVLAGGYWYVTSRPIAHQVSSDPWKVGIGDRLLLELLGAGPLLAIEGADNEGVDVRFDRAHLDESTAKSLRDDFALTIPTSDGAISWTTTQTGIGHTMIDITLEADRGVPEVQIAHIGEGPHPGLNIVPHNARLKVQLGVLLDTSGTAPVSAEQKALQIAERTVVHLPGAVPITVEVPEDHAFILTFPSRKPASIIHLGAAEDTLAASSGLSLRSAAVRPSDVSVDTLYACAANEGLDYWQLGDPASQDCATTPILLRATKLELRPDSAIVTIHGSAWFTKNGVWVTDDRFNKYIGTNLVLGLLIGAIITSLCTMALTAVFGRQ
ncbi:hypothetical protein [Paraburkholderia sp. BL10I2N1]|uniref:hypothetical protein n=1 Tax=Paraburkholderia sp. BL10I2N1 TaxID=1938796 RepID=UPI00105C22DE|nr:hypothetical protein [Paraburkholderia sp. BL10I2N1]